MSAIPQLTLEAGHVYRLRDLSAFTADTARLAKRLVAEGTLISLEQGLFVHPKPGRFGAVPPSDEQLMRAFLGHTPFVLTGPERWNELGLGAVAVFAHRLVYNAKRSGRFVLAGRPFVLRRIRFPLPQPPPEWFVVDLLEHAEQAASSRNCLADALIEAVQQTRFDDCLLLELAHEFGSRRTVEFLRRRLTGVRA